MKRLIVTALSIILLIPFHAAAGVIEPARVTFVDGDIMFRTPDTDEWLPASVNTPLDEGDEVWCPDGAKAEIQIPDGSTIRVDGNSRLNLLANEEKFIHLNLASGRLYLRTSQSSSANSIQIDADDTTVLPSARTRLRLDMLPNGEEDVSIFKGSAYVEGNGSRTRVRAGEHIALEDGHSELLQLNAPDTWESWNMDRDRIQSNAAKVDSNLPDELRTYSGELEANGRWVRVPEYGMVWRPVVILSDDWAPYRSGRWIWRGGDYVWISTESWGWAPYHYGRWTVISNLGWCWIPPVRGDVYWGPGYVGWFRTDTHVGWAPLAPGEIYYGYGYHGRQSVNISVTSVNITSIDYRNRHLRGGLTVLPQNDFLKGRAPASQPAINSSVSVSAGSPRIHPAKEIRTTVIKQTTPRQISPVTDHQDVRKLRQRFPRVTPEPDSRQHYQQAAPVVAPQQRELPQPVGLPPAVHLRPDSSQREKPRQEPTRREFKQKKIWRIKTPASSQETAPKVIDHKSRER
jgi:hypothetical protein